MENECLRISKHELFVLNIRLNGFFDNDNWSMIYDDCRWDNKPSSALKLNRFRSGQGLLKSPSLVTGDCCQEKFNFQHCSTVSCNDSVAAVWRTLKNSFLEQVPPFQESDIKFSWKWCRWRKIFSRVFHITSSLSSMRTYFLNMISMNMKCCSLFISIILIFVLSSHPRRPICFIWDVGYSGVWSRYLGVWIVFFYCLIFHHKLQ